MGRYEVYRWTPAEVLARIVYRGDCWEWHGKLDTHGYGKLGGNRRTHRVIYEALVGPVPDGLVLDHLCRNTICCNPAHLEPVTQGENVRRGISLWAINARKTHCPRGHAYDDANTTRYRNERRCRECHRERCRQYRTASKEAA